MAPEPGWRDAPKSALSLLQSARFSQRFRHPPPAPYGTAGMLRTGRDAAILRVAERDGIPIDRLAEMFGLSSRTIFHVLHTGRSQGLLV